MSTLTEIFALIGLASTLALIVLGVLLAHRVRERNADLGKLRVYGFVGQEAAAVVEAGGTPVVIDGEAVCKALVRCESCTCYCHASLSAGILERVIEVQAVRKGEEP